MDGEENCNNQLPPPTSPAPSIPEYERDTEYYYMDGSAVFLAGKTLFKVWASRLAADPGVSGYEFEPLMKGALDFSSPSEDKLGSSDTCPIILSNVNETQFRRFLFVVLGRVGEAEYTKFLASIQDSKSHDSALVARLAAAGTLAVQFGLNKLDSWVNVQLHHVIQRSSPKIILHIGSPLKNVLQPIVTYTRRTHVTTSQLDILSGVQFGLFYIQDFFKKKNLSLQEFINWYRNRSLLLHDPDLFGYIFAVVLSLGHLSTEWKKLLSREERRVFYVASTVLTNISQHETIKVGWLAAPKSLKDICSEPTCSRAFEGCWKATFATCETLDSPVPLEDVSELLNLPKFRYSFVERSQAWECTSNCAQKTVAKVDSAIVQVFAGIAEMHKQFERYILVPEPAQ